MENDSHCHMYVSDHYDLHICALLKITIIRNQQEKAQNWIFSHCQIDVYCIYFVDRLPHSCVDTFIKSLGRVPRECFAYLWWKMDTLWKFVNEIYAKRIMDGNRNGIKICRNVMSAGFFPFRVHAIKGNSCFKKLILKNHN